MTTFLAEVLAGRERPENIDNWVEAWHDNYDDGRSLANFLGMTDEECVRWVSDPSVLEEIVQNHHQNQETSS